jgi:hypothetical protein
MEALGEAQETANLIAACCDRIEAEDGYVRGMPGDPLPGEMRMNARLATKLVVRATKPRSEATQAPHFAAARWDDSWRSSAWSLGLPRHPAWAAPRFAQPSRNEPSRPSAGCAEFP